MAELIGVSQTTIARAERDGASVTLPVLTAILTMGGLHFAVLDEFDDEILTMRPDAVRDRAGRQYPAHLDPWVPSRASGPFPRWRTPPRPAPPLNYRRRPGRDHDRRRTGTQLYHPGPEDVEAMRRRDREGLGSRCHPLGKPLETIDCTCPDECEAACVRDCPCQCEPTGWLDNVQRTATVMPVAADPTPDPEVAEAADADPPTAVPAGARRIHGGERPADAVQPDRATDQVLGSQGSSGDQCQHGRVIGSAHAVRAVELELPGDHPGQGQGGCGRRPRTGGRLGHVGLGVAVIGWNWPRWWASRGHRWTRARRRR